MLSLKLDVLASRLTVCALFSAFCLAGAGSAFGQISTSTNASLAPSAVDLGTTPVATVTVTASDGSTPDSSVTCAIQTRGHNASYSATLQSGVASIPLQSVAQDPVGNYTLACSYVGSSNYAASSANTISFSIISPISTTTTVSVAPSSVTYGSSPVATVTVTASDGSTPTGSVSCNIQTRGHNAAYSSALTNGNASIALTTIAQDPVGTYSLVCSYPGYSSYTASSSSTINLNVTQALPVITWGAPASISAGTALSATQLDATANIAGSFTYSPAAGTVLPAGNNTLSVTFTPTDTTDYAAATDTVTLAVSGGPTTTSLSSSANPSVYGAGLTLTASVTGSGGSGPTGTVNFWDNGSSIGTATVASGVASLMASSLNAGSHSVTAVYSGDATYQGSTSSAVTEQIQPDATSTVVSLSPSTSYPGTVVAADISVSNTSVSSVPPTGTVTCNGTGIAQPFTGNLSSGSATWTIQNLQIGSYPITCSYAATANFAGSSSQAVTESMIAAPQAQWTLVSPMSSSLRYQTASLLQNGNVLIAGGENNAEDGDQGAVSTAQIYTPGTGFSSTGSMFAPRFGHTATVLSDDTVLVAGGEDYASGVMSATEIYNPSANPAVFSPGPALKNPRSEHTATLLQDGTILIAGGLTGAIGQGEWPIAQAEIYTPGSIPENGAFAAAGNMQTPRSQHTATLLQNGQVLFVGGRDANNEATSSAELYTPSTGQFTSTGSLNIGRCLHTATLLPNGMVLIVGGSDSNGNAIQSAELYDPTAGSFTTLAATLNTARYAHGATMLNDGSVLIFGGLTDVRGTTTSSSEKYVYDASSGGTFSVGPTLNDARGFVTTTVLPDSTVLTMGGYEQGSLLSSAEVYDDASKITGVINPKYVVLGLTYAPPGPNSYVNYQNTVYVGNSTQIDKTFSTGEEVKVSIASRGGVPGWLGGASATVTGTSTTGFTQTNDYANTVTVTGQTSNMWHTPGTADAFSPVNHDYDLIWIWLNPLVVLTADANQPDALPIWNGYAYNMDDQANGGPQGMDVWPTPVGCLNGDFTANECQETWHKLARYWATGEYFPNGDVPALTQADYNQILTFDPFATINGAPSDYSISLDGNNPGTTMDGRYTQATTTPPSGTIVGSLENIPYPQALPGDPPPSDTYNTTYSNSTQNSHTATHITNQSFSLEQSYQGNFFTASVSYHLTQTATLTWTNKSITTLTNTQTQTDTAYIQGPPCNQPYCTPSYSGIAPNQPANFNVYQDNLFGTFMFFGTN